MDSSHSLTTIKVGKRDPPLWMVFMALVMIMMIAAYVALPALINSYGSEEYGPSITVNWSRPIDKTQHNSINGAQHDKDGRPVDHGEQSQTTDSLQVQTQHGWIKGIASDGVRAFHGVPYAQPPIGQLRWAAPKEMEPWSPQVYDATFKRNGCPQRCTFHQYCPRNASEDCLYLEIFTPLEASATSQLPVMAYLHGGDFTQMSAMSSVYEPSYLVKRTHVLVILIEYRLGSLGFLAHTYTDASQDLMANFGLMDQALALEWIQGNVEAFGGDPKKVTLVGQSAGSQSALIHLQSPGTSQKFRSVILESTPVSLPFKTSTEALKQTQRFAGLAGCEDTKINTTVDMDCLKKLHIDAILNAQDQIKSFDSSYLSKAQPWGPAVDEKIVFSQLLDSFEYLDLYRKPILWGVTAEEALIFVKSWFQRPTGFIVYTLALSILGEGVDRDRIKSLYPSTSEDSREEVSAMATDFLFRCPVQWAAKKLHSQGIHPMWNYVWHKSLIFSKSHFGYTCSNRSCHSIEIPYIFHNFDDLNTTLADLRLSDAIIDYYGNFIKNGNPNDRQEMTGSDVSLPDWPEAFARDKYQTLGFNQDGTIAPETGVAEDRCNLWIDKKFKLKP